jgi:HEAT repeat protein
LAGPGGLPSYLPFTASTAIAARMTSRSAVPIPPMARPKTALPIPCLRGLRRISRTARRPASKALRTMGPMAEAEVGKYLRHSDWGVQVEACKVLKQIGTRKSIPALQEAAADKNRFVATEAKEALVTASKRP